MSEIWETFQVLVAPYQRADDVVECRAIRIVRTRVRVDDPVLSGGCHHERGELKPPRAHGVPFAAGHSLGNWFSQGNEA